MARKLKAQRIEQLVEATNLNSDAELIVSSSGNTYRASIATLSAALGLPGSGGGSDSDGDDSSDGTLKLNQFTSGMYVKNVTVDLDPELMDGDSTEDGTTSKVVYTKPLEINEDCNVYATVYPDIAAVKQLCSIYFGIQVGGSNGQYATIASDVITSKSDGGAEGSTNAAFKAIAGSGLSCRGFIEFIDTSITSIPNVNMQLKASLVKLNDAFGLQSRSFTMTVGTASSGGWFHSNVIKFTDNELPKDKGYESGLVTLQGYFSLKAIAPVYLECSLDGSTWQNLAVKHVGTTKTLVDFGTFYVENGMQLRLSTTSRPTVKSISAPYAACTAIISFKAISKLAGNEENATLSSRVEVLDMIAKNSTRVTKFGYKSDVTAPYFYARNLIFGKEDSVMVFDPDKHVIQQQDNSGEFYYQMGRSDYHPDASWTLSALGLTTLGMSNDGTSKVKTYGSKITIDGKVLYKSALMSSLTSIEIGSDVTSIEDYCFKDFVNLTSVSIPSSVEYIGGDQTFANTEGTVTYVPSSKLQKVWFNGSHQFQTSKTYSKVIYTNVCEQTFANCSALTSLQNFEKCDVDAIGPKTFYMTSLSSINIPNTVEYLDWSAFSKTPKLSVVMIPSTVKTIANPKIRHIDGSTNYSREVLSWIGVKLSGDASEYTSDSETSIKIRDEINTAFNKSDIIGTAYNNGLMDLKAKANNVNLAGVKMIAYDKNCQLIVKGGNAYYCTFKIAYDGNPFAIYTIAPDSITPKYAAT